MVDSGESRCLYMASPLQLVQSNPSFQKIWHHQSVTCFGQGLTQIQVADYWPELAVQLSCASYRTTGTLQEPSTQIKRRLRQYLPWRRMITQNWDSSELSHLPEFHSGPF